MLNEVTSYHFPKAEKLCSKRIIEAIYEKGYKLKQYPFMLHYIEVDAATNMAFPVQIATAVPKRRIKLAVKRNRIRRQLREAYRLNKQQLIAEVLRQEKKMALFLVYIGKEKEPYDFIEKKLKLLLNTLTEQINHKTKDEN
jgi:ribonuclease P protein component